MYHWYTPTWLLHDPVFSVIIGIFKESMDGGNYLHALMLVRVVSLNMPSQTTVPACAHPARAAMPTRNNKPFIFSIFLSSF